MNYCGIQVSVGLYLGDCYRIYGGCFYVRLNVVLTTFRTWRVHLWLVKGHLVQNGLWIGRGLSPIQGHQETNGLTEQSMVLQMI